MQNPEDFAWLCRTSPNTLFVLLVIIDSVCLNFYFIYFPKRQIQKKQTTKTIYSNKFFDNFHLSEFSFARSRLRRIRQHFNMVSLRIQRIALYMHVQGTCMYVYECTCVCRYIFLWLMWQKTSSSCLVLIKKKSKQNLQVENIIVMSSSYKKKYPNSRKHHRHVQFL